MYIDSMFLQNIFTKFGHSASWHNVLSITSQIVNAYTKLTISPLILKAVCIMKYCLRSNLNITNSNTKPITKL